MQFPALTKEQTNPELAGFANGQDIITKLLAQRLSMLDAQKQQKLMPFVEPNAKADLQTKELSNQWNPQIWQSEIGLRGAESNKIKYLLDHPGFMGGDETKTLEALKQMGLLNNNYQQNMPGNQQQNNFSQQSRAQQGQQLAQASQISEAVQNQQKAMNIPQSQLNTGQGSPSGQGFNVNSLVQALIQKPMTDLQYKNTLTQVMQQNLASKAYTSMPSIEKEYSISQARAFGYTGEQASKLFNEGYDLAALAKLKGYDADNPSSWPMARGAPTTAIQTRIQRANSTLAALEAIDPEISAAYATYSPRFANISPGLIKDMLTGENPDKQAEILAAYALYPELQALRINAQGGNVGEGAIAHMADASFARLNTLQLSPNSTVYQKVQKRIMNYMKKMNRAENSAIYAQRNQSYEDDDKANSNIDLSNVSDAELQRIAGGR